MCFPFFFLDLVNVYFCVVFRITFAKVQPCASDVKYFAIFFQFICRYIYKSLLFAEKIKQAHGCYMFKLSGFIRKSIILMMTMPSSLIYDGARPPTIIIF